MSQPLTSITAIPLPGHGAQGARDDYEHAVQLAGGLIRYDIIALVAGDGSVAVTWTGHLPNGSAFRGVSLYQVADGRVTEARNAFIDPPPFTGTERACPTAERVSD